MKCPDCGNPVGTDAQFCPKCFARIEPPTLWQKLLRFFSSEGKARKPFIQIKKTVSIKTTDAKGESHEYHSVDELPPELRKEVENLESEALKSSVRSSSSDRLHMTITSRGKASLIKVKDASGKERIYHSVEELPPEIRAAFEKAQTKSKE